MIVLIICMPLWMIAIGYCAFLFEKETDLILLKMEKVKSHNEGYLEGIRHVESMDGYYIVREVKRDIITMKSVVRLSRLQHEFSRNPNELDKIVKRQLLEGLVRELDKNKLLVVKSMDEFNPYPELIFEASVDVLTPLPVYGKSIIETFYENGLFDKNSYEQESNQHRTES